MLGRFLKHDEKKIVMIVHREEEIEKKYTDNNSLFLITVAEQLRYV